MGVILTEVASVAFQWGVSGRTSIVRITPATTLARS